jgi:hypothetical protein
MPNTNPGESLDAEGIPDIESAPPGKDIETSDEGMMAPRDHPIAAGVDPAYATTASEERVGESVAARAAREEPDFGERVEAADTIGARLMQPDSDVDPRDDTADEVADVVEDEQRAPTAEEAAMHVVSEDAADDMDPAVERAQYLEGR